jgi:hypothetical protein
MQTRSQTKAYRENRDRLLAKYNGVVLEPVVYTAPKIKNTTKQQEYSVEIDFDGASRAWLANKQPLLNSTYKYICLGKTKNGTMCKRTPIVHTDYCPCHKR